MFMMLHLIVLKTEVDALIALGVKNILMNM